MTDSPSTRILPLDGIRGLAALAVALFHFQALFSPNLYIGHAYLAVDLFFILSGIVLTHVYEEGILDGSVTLREFLVNRLARLYPLHLATLGVILVLDLWVFPRDLGSQGPLFLIPPVWRTGLLNLFLLQNVGIGSGCSWDGPAWSISVELAVNFLWFLLLFRRASSLLFAPFIAGAAVLLVGQSLAHEGFHTYGGFIKENALGVINLGLLRGVSGFFIGCLLQRHCLRSHRFPFFERSKANGMVAGIVLLTLALLYFGRTVLVLIAGEDYLLVWIIFPLLILFALHEGTWLNRFLCLKPLLWLGEISYSIYLLHWIVGKVIERGNGVLFPIIPKPWLGFLFLAICLGCSQLCYQILEKPWRRRIKVWFLAKPHPAVSRQN